MRCDGDEVFSFFPCIAMEADAEWDLEEGDEFTVKWLDTVDYDPQCPSSIYYPGAAATAQPASPQPPGLSRADVRGCCVASCCRGARKADGRCGVMARQRATTRSTAARSSARSGTRQREAGRG